LPLGFADLAVIHRNCVLLAMPATVSLWALNRVFPAPFEGLRCIGHLAGNRYFREGGEAFASRPAPFSERSELGAGIQAGGALLNRRLPSMRAGGATNFSAHMPDGGRRSGGADVIGAMAVAGWGLPGCKTANTAG